MAANYRTLKEAVDAAKDRFVERNTISKHLHEEANKSLPGGNTRSLLYTAPFPIFMARGSDSTLYSEDGHKYIDLVGELTAGLYGHNHPTILEAIRSTIDKIGLNLGATSTLEAQHASLICQRFNLDRVRFTNSGTEANLHAISGAKRFTGRRKVVVFTGAYHGSCFSFPEAKPAENTIDRGDWIIAEYNNLEDAKHKIEESGDVAAVLVEGMQGGGPCFVGTHEFLHQVQESASKAGAVFILDEVMTSRFSDGGLQKLEGLSPDITTLGKYLGGGLSFGAFGGCKDIMSVYDPRISTALAHSGTFNNNTLSMAAGFAGLSKIYTPEVAKAFNEQGDSLRRRLEELSHGTKLTVTGRGSLIGIHFVEDGNKDLKSCKDRKDDHALKELFWLEMLEAGIWTSKRGSISLILGTPSESLDHVVTCVKSFLEKYADFVRV